jgi:hypothetical protein
LPVTITTLVLLFAVLIVFSFGISRNVEGQVTFFYNEQIDNAPVYVVVVLDKGGAVSARAPSNFDFRKGRKAVLSEKSSIFGTKSYTFLAYVD